MTSLHHLDDRLMLAVNSFARHTPWLHGVVLAYATYGVVLFAVLLLTGLILTRHDSSRLLAASGWAAVAPVLAVALNQPLGRLVGESRPYAAHPDLLRLVSPTTDFSFPSDHCVMAGAVAVGLLLVSRRLGLIAVVLALLMAFARVYVAAHYPWDVAAGLLFGGGVTALGWVLLRRPLTVVTGWLRVRPGLRTAFLVSAPAG